MGMPIHNHIEAIGYSGLDDGFHTANIALRVLQEASLVLCAHSHTHDTRLPVFSKGIHRPCRIEPILSPARIGPEKARPREGGHLSMLTANMRPNDRETSVFRNRRHLDLMIIGCLRWGCMAQRKQQAYKQQSLEQSKHSLFRADNVPKLGIEADIDYSFISGSFKPIPL